MTATQTLEPPRPLAPRRAPARPRRAAGPAPDRLADRPLVGLLLFLVGLFTAYLVIGVVAWDVAGDFINWAGPVSVLVACAWTAYRVLVSHPQAFWTPVPWFLAASGAYFGLGPLVYVLGNDETVAFVNVLWPVGADDLWRTNVLNAVGLLATVGGCVLTSRLLARLSPGARASGKWAGASAKAAAVLFIAVGLPVRYFLVLPYEWGLLNFVLPGAVYSLADMALLGVLLLSYVAATERGAWRLALGALLASTLVVEFLSFNKSSLLLVLVMAALGHYMATRRAARLGLAVAGIFVVYAVVAPVVTWGRESLAQEEGTQSRAPLGKRWSIAGEGVQRWTEGTLNLDRKQGWLSRLNYANAQAFAMHRYDAGYPGDSYGMALYAFVPRFLDPDKPVITEVAVDFTQLAYGHRFSSTGIGIYGEAYWNGGWPAVVAVAALIGVLLAWLSRVALARLARPEWLFLPCAFLGLKMGFRIDGWLVGDYLGSAVLYVAYYLFIRFLNALK